MVSVGAGGGGGIDTAVIATAAAVVKAAGVPVGPGVAGFWGVVAPEGLKEEL